MADKISGIDLDRPSLEKIDHSIDYLAEQKNLYRFTEESLEHFRRRLQCALKHPANGTIAGIRAGTCRALGGLIEPLICITPTLVNNIPVAKFPYVEITNTHIEFYTNMETLDAKFSILKDLPSEEESVLYYMKELKNYLDTSIFWTIKRPMSETMFWKRTRFLYPLTSAAFLKTYSITLGMHQFTDRNEYILDTSIRSEQSFLQHAKTSVDEVLVHGDYYFDKEYQRLYTKRKDQELYGTVYASSIKINVELEYCPVQFYELSNPVIKEAWSEKIKSEDNVNYESIEPNADLWALIENSFINDQSFWFSMDENDTPIDIRQAYIRGDILTDDLIDFYIKKQNLRSLL